MPEFVHSTNHPNQMSTEDDQANQALFDAALAGDETDPAPAASEAPTTTAEQPDGGQPASADQQPPAEVDPFAGLSPQVRELLGTIPQLQHAAQANARLAGMVPALQSRIDKLTAPAPSQPATAPSRFAAIERVRDDLPEIADALDEIVRALPAQQATPDPVPPEQPAQAPDPQIEALDELRPAWGKELSSTDYQLWLSTQALEYRQSVNSTQKASVILKSLQHFDAHVERTKSTRQAADTRTARMSSAVTPRGDGRRQTGPASDDLQAIFDAALQGG